MGKPGKGGKKAAKKARAAQAQSDKQAQRTTKRALKKKQFQRDKNRYMNEFRQFQLQLAEIGLQCYDVPGDGNCLFRALSHQRDQTTENHQKYRQAIMTYIEEHRGDFEWFIEDDEPFEVYVGRLREDGQWGGQLEIQAASVLYGQNIVIHRLNEPRWEVVNHFGPDANNNLMHLSYHDQMHYGSVKPLDIATLGQYVDTAADDKDATLDATVGSNTDEPTRKGGTGYELGSTSKGMVLPDWWDEAKYGKKVTALVKMSNCQDSDLARKALIQHKGDFNTALLALQNGDSLSSANDPDHDEESEVYQQAIAATKNSYVITSRIEKPEPVVTAMATPTAVSDIDTQENGMIPETSKGKGQGKGKGLVVGRGRNQKLSRMQKKRMQAELKAAKKKAQAAELASEEVATAIQGSTRNLGALAI